VPDLALATEQAVANGQSVETDREVRFSPAEEADHQSEGPAEGGRRHAPRHRAGQLVPGTVAKRTAGGQEEPDRPADDQARQGIANSTALSGASGKPSVRITMERFQSAATS
jgi:hypothetical protein